MGEILFILFLLIVIGGLIGVFLKVRDDERDKVEQRKAIDKYNRQK